MALTLILASMSLNLSKSFREALLFWTISFLPQELFSHLFLTSAQGGGLLYVVHPHNNWEPPSFCLRREKIYMVTESIIHTCSIHCLNQGFLLGNPFDVDFDISECKPLKVNLASYHVGGIHKSLKKGAFLKNFGLLA